MAAQSHHDHDRDELTGIERMYGVGRVLADVYDDCWRRGIPITPKIQLQAQQTALAWLRAQQMRDEWYQTQPDAAANE